MKNALIINAHQRWENFAEGKLNQSFASVAEDRLTMLGKVRISRSFLPKLTR